MQYRQTLPDIITQYHHSHAISIIPRNIGKPFLHLYALLPNTCHSLTQYLYILYLPHLHPAILPHSRHNHTQCFHTLATVSHNTFTHLSQPTVPIWQHTLATVVLRNCDRARNLYACSRVCDLLIPSIATLCPCSEITVSGDLWFMTPVIIIKGREGGRERGREG